MRVVEVVVNGNTVGRLEAKAGRLLKSTVWVRLSDEMQFVDLVMTGFDPGESGMLYWPRVRLSITDEVCVRVVESDSCDAPERRDSPPPDAYPVS